MKQQTIRYPSRALRALTLAAIGGLLVGPVRAVAQTDAAPRKPGSQSTTFGIDYSYTAFQSDIDPWHVVATSVGHGWPGGTIIGRVNVARRFATTGAQFEVDAYPTFGELTYGYLNIGYSGANIFPDWRFGGEAFRSLPHAWEGSLGFRHLRFGGPPVTLFTGSVAKYQGNYWYSLRPYIRDKDTGLSASASLTTRRYYADGDNYVGFRVGYGSTPGDRLTAEELARTSSITAGVQGSRTMSPRRIGTWMLTYDREELSPSRFRNRWEISGGLKFQF